MNFETDATIPDGAVDVIESIDVLLVEDNPGDKLLIETHLDKIDSRLIEAPIVVEQATDLTSAIEQLESRSFDAILLDLNLPESRGMETVDRLLPHTARIPVIVLTGLADDDLAFGAIERGTDDFLIKSEIDASRLGRSLRFALERRKRSLQTAIIESADVGMLLVDLDNGDSNVTFVNPACIELAGYTVDQWHREGLSVLDGKKTAPRARQRLRASTAVGQSDVIRQLSYRDDGSTFWCSIRAIPITGTSSEPTHILYSLADVTEAVEREKKAAISNRRNILGTIAETLSQELYNPLAFLSSNLEFVTENLRSYNETDGATLNNTNLAVFLDSLEDALQGAKMLREVIGDLSRLVGDDDGKQFQLERFAVTDPIDTSLSICRNHISKRAQLIYDNKAPIEVVADRSRLGLAILNILMNAALAIDDAGPGDHSVRITTDRNGDDVVISIRDTGCGMTPEVASQALEASFSDWKSSDGMGYGLSFSKEVVDRLGGDLVIDSTAGVGTTVELRLPGADSSDAPDI